MNKKLQVPPPKPVYWRIKIRGLEEQTLGTCRTAFDAVRMYRKVDGTSPAFSELDYAEQVEG